MPMQHDRRMALIHTSRFRLVLSVILKRRNLRSSQKKLAVLLTVLVRPIPLIFFIKQG